MSQRIDYFFTCISPFSYFGHRAIKAVADKHGAELVLRPVRLGDVFATSGAVPLPQRTPARQRYRLIEIQRISEMRGVPVNLKPAFFPADPTLADATVAILVDRGADAFDYLESLYRSVWTDEDNVADEATVAEKLTDAGFDSSDIIAAARSQKAAGLIAQNTADAIAAGAMGSPSYVLNGEVFWGQDRIDYLNFALTTRRAPFTA